MLPPRLKKQSRIMGTTPNVYQHSVDLLVVESDVDDQSVVVQLVKLVEPLVIKAPSEVWKGNSL